MAEAQAAGRRKEVVGNVVSNRMNKTIVVQVVRRRSHPLYTRVPTGSPVSLIRTAAF